MELANHFTQFYILLLEQKLGFLVHCSFLFSENGACLGVERNRLGSVSPRRISGASSVSGGGYYSDERERHHSLSQVTHNVH